MTITGIAGSIGSGKSFKQLHYALEQVDKKKKKLVTNFHLNIRQLRIYAGLKKYHWLGWLCDTGQITILDGCTNLSDIVSFHDSICCLDEAGIFLNARDFSKTPKKLLMDLCQSRKTGSDLIWCAQFESQVDAQFRMLTQFWIHCGGVSAYDRTMRRPKLVCKSYHYFDANSYQSWLSDVKARNSYFKTRFQYAYKSEGGFLTKADKQLFKCFDSFTRLELQSGYASNSLSREFCTLPSDYYFNLLGSDYSPDRDPLRGSIRPRRLKKIKPRFQELITG